MEEEKKFEPAKFEKDNVDEIKPFNKKKFFIIAGIGGFILFLLGTMLGMVSMVGQAPDCPEPTPCPVITCPTCEDCVATTCPPCVNGTTTVYECDDANAPDCYVYIKRLVELEIDYDTCMIANNTGYVETLQNNVTQLTNQLKTCTDILDAISDYI